MASKSIGSLYAELSLRDKMSHGLGKAQKSLRAFGATSAKYAAAGTAMLGAAMVAGTKRTLNQADALDDLSAATGVAVSDAMGFQQAYKEGGLAADQFGKEVGKMQKTIADSLGGKGNSDVFKSLGLDVEKLIEMSPADQFDTIARSIMGVENMAKRVSAARDIFGKSGGGLLAVFGNIDEARQSLGRMPEVAEKFAGAMGRANDLIGRLPNKSDQFFTGFTGGIIGELLPALEKTNTHDFTTLGENIGQAVATGFKGLTDGTIWDIAALKASAMILGIGENLSNVLSAAINASFDVIGNKTQSFAQRQIDDIKLGFADIFGSKAQADSVWKEIDGKKSAGMSFTDQFGKYTKAGNDLNKNTLSSDFGKLADDLWNRLSGKMKSGLDFAAGIGKSPAITPAATEDIAAAVSTRSFEAENPTDEYITRGLQISGAPSSADRMAEKQTKLLEEIRDAVKSPFQPKIASVFR